MRRKAALLSLFMLFSLLLASCVLLGETAPPVLETPMTDEVMYDRELAAYITVEGDCTIADYAEIQGENYRCGVFHLRSPEYVYTTGSGVPMAVCDQIIWEIVVLRNDTVVDVLRIENDAHGDAVPSCADLVTEVDVDFDGCSDLLLCLGHFGTEGAVYYQCWLTRGDTLLHCPSFTGIANPALDPERKEVLSQWRNTAVSHGYGVYRFLDGAFTMVERLTEQPAEMNSGSEELVWSWTDESFIDGAWQVREYFTQNDYDVKTLYSEKVYGDTARWDIGSERWRSLYQDKVMSDMEGE